VVIEYGEMRKIGRMKWGTIHENSLCDFIVTMVIIMFWTVFALHAKHCETEGALMTGKPSDILLVQKGL
jgi:hypothetical protein